MKKRKIQNPLGEDPGKFNKNCDGFCWQIKLLGNEIVIRSI